MRRHTPPPPGGPRTAPEGDPQIWPRPSTSILGPPTASTLSRPGPTSLLTHTSEPTCSGSAYVSALAPYGRPRVALFGRPLTAPSRSATAKSATVSSISAGGQNTRSARPRNRGAAGMRWPRPRVVGSAPEGRITMADATETKLGVIQGIGRYRGATAPRGCPRGRRRDNGHRGLHVDRRAAP